MHKVVLMTSSKGNIFRVTGHLCGEFTSHRWIPHTNASDAELWCFLYLRLNKRFSKQWWGWWFKMPWRPLWRHCNDYTSAVYIIGIDTNIEVIVVSLTTWEAHHSPRAKPEGCGELPMSLMRQQWPKLRYQFLLYHDETKLMLNKQILSI